MIGGAAMPHGAALRVAAVIAVLLAGPARAEVANRIVATIDGEPITAHELREWVKERGEDSPAGDALELRPGATDHDGLIAELIALLRRLSAA